MECSDLKKDAGSFVELEAHGSLTRSRLLDAADKIRSERKA